MDQRATRIGPKLKGNRCRRIERIDDKINRCRRDERT
jgi:hypothetical protein